MSTEFVELTGVANWAHKLFETDTEYGTYQLQLVMDDESAEKFATSGSMLKLYNTDGATSINPKRKENLGKPRVVDADGNAWPEDAQIGNGSEVSVLVEMYPSKRGKGTRLEAVKITKLVKFDPDSFDPTENAKEAYANGDLPF